MNIIYKCFIFLYSVEFTNHIDNCEYIYYKLLIIKFNDMVSKLKDLKNNLFFDIYLP